MAATLKDGNEQVVEVTGESVKFHMAKLNFNSEITNATATETNGSVGTVNYYWSGGETASIGTMRCEFEVPFPTELVETYPNSGFISIQITDDIT